MAQEIRAGLADGASAHGVSGRPRRVIHRHRVREHTVRARRHTSGPIGSGPVPDIPGLVAIIVVGGLLFLGAYLGSPTFRRWRECRHKP